MGGNWVVVVVVVVMLRKRSLQPGGSKLCCTEREGRRAETTVGPTTEGVWIWGVTRARPDRGRRSGCCLGGAGALSGSRCQRRG